MRRTPLQPPPYATDRATLAREVVVETFRASGPGGQHVNTTNSALRLTHVPSGIVVIAQDSPSQFRNRELAFRRLISRLRILNHVPAPRIATRPTFASTARRIEAKQRRSETKRQRAKIRDEE